MQIMCYRVKVIDSIQLLKELNTNDDSSDTNVWLLLYLSYPCGEGITDH